MRHFKKFTWLFITVLLLASCRSIPPPLSTPSPYVIKAGISPYLSSTYQAQVAACSRELPGTAVQYFPAAASYPDPLNYDLLIWWGDPALYSPLFTSQLTAYQLGYDELQVITSPENRLYRISGSDIRQIFSGSLQSWSDLPDSELNGSIQLWSYPSGTPVREIFQTHLLNEMQISSAARIVPGSGEMVTEVAATPGSIGFALTSSIENSEDEIKILRLEKDLTFPVLAVTPKDDQLMQLLISCLQE